MRSVLVLALAVGTLGLPATTRADRGTRTATAAEPGGAPEAPAEQLSLADALSRALSRHPSLVQAHAEVRRAEALVTEARAASLPTLTASALYTRLDAARTTSALQGLNADGSFRYAAREIAPADQLSLNLQLSVPLVAPGPWMSWSHAEDGLEVSRASAAEARRQVAVAVARTYIAVLSQRALVATAERGRDTARAHHDFARTRRAGGVGNRLDEIRAASELQVVEAQLQTAYAGLARAREALGVLVASEHPVDAQPGGVTLPPAAALPEALAAARTQRTDLRALERRLAAAKALHRDRWVHYVPTLTALFQPYLQSYTTSVQPRDSGWQAQLLLGLPLFDGGLRYGVGAEREALVADAEARVDAALRQATAEVRTAFEVVLRADLSLASSRAAAQLAGEALALANLAYGAGATTNLEVIDAERRARDAETAVAIAEDNARQARLDLLAASGAFP